jgi:complex I intermediate-associated protein 30 (CIA30)
MGDVEGALVFHGAHGARGASVRTLLPRGALVGAAGLTLSVRGDGRRYGVYLKRDSRPTDDVFIAWFETSVGAPLDVALPFGSFAHRREGRGLGDAILPDDVRMLGSLADDRPGPFRLEIASVGVAS